MLRAGIIVGLLNFSLIVPPAIADEYNEIERAWSTLRDGHCKLAWDKVWPLAKNGNQRARHFLYNSVASGRMALPGVSGDPETYYRQYLPLAAYAAVTTADQLSYSGPDLDPGRKWLRTDILNVLKNLNLDPNGERVRRCYASDTPLPECLNVAVALGVIPEFGDYAQKTEEAARKTGNDARCMPRH